MALGLRKFEDDFCEKKCGERVTEICWRRRQGEPCKAHRLHQEQRKEEIRQEHIANIEGHQRREQMKEIKESDLLDSKGDDVSDEEYVENEKSFILEEL